MSKNNLVQLAVYDLSRGMAKQYVGKMLGVDIEAIYHTGVRIYGYEYFYSDGIQKMLPDDVVRQFGLTPIEIIPMGETEIPEEFADMFISENRALYTSETYDLLTHNCNNFSDEFVEFLTGNHIPSKIVNLPQLLINTPQGKAIAPLLEQFGATKAIPLSTGQSSSAPLSTGQSSSASAPTQTIPSSQSQTVHSDMSINEDCLSPWTAFNTELALSNMHQRALFSEQFHSVAKLAFFLDSKTKSNQGSFVGLKQYYTLLSNQDQKDESLLYDLLLLLIPNLSILSHSVHKYNIHSETLFNDALTLFATISADNTIASSLRVMSMIAISAMCCDEMSDIMWNNPVFLNLLSNINLNINEDMYSRFAKCCLLANCCKIVKVSGDNEDICDEGVKIMNDLVSTLFDEDIKEILDIRITGLYIIAKRGRELEKITLQSSGVEEGSSLKIHDCDIKWNKLIQLCCN